MIFQFKSFRCFFILLIMYGTVSTKYSSISVTNSGALSPLQTDVAMVFYATVHNDGNHIQIVRLSMVQCCIINADASNDCNSMKLRSGLGKALQPNQSYNLTMYWINMHLFGRKGECHLNVNCQSQDSSKNGNAESTIELTIAFDVTSLSEPSDDVLQSIYTVIEGKSTNQNNKRCDILDQDLLMKCKSRQCVLDYSGHRSFYDQKKKTCEITPDCSDGENMMLSPVTNMCRKQSPTSKVITSFTKEMRAGVNDTNNIAVRQTKAIAVEPIKVICVHGKMMDNGHCQCDEHWLSQNFDPKKFDPEKMPYQMCNVRSSQGEIEDRTNDTMYTFTALLLILLVILPCCVIGLACFLHSKRKKRKLMEAEMSNKLLKQDEESDDEDVITEITSRREIKKSSTSHRSSQEPDNGDSFQDSLDDNEALKTPPSFTYFSTTQSPTNSKDQLNASNTNNANNASHNVETNMKLNPDRPSKYDAHHHSTTASHVISRQPSRKANVGKHKQKVWEMYPNRVISDPGTFQKFQPLSRYEDIPLIDLELVNTVHNAFRSKSAPMMNHDLSYVPQKLYAVSSPGNTDVGTQMQTLFENEITRENSTESVVKCNIPQNEVNLEMDPSQTDVRTSVKRKQELWAQFLKEYSEKNPIRQHSEFGIEDTQFSPVQSHACQAKSLPIVSTNKKESDVTTHSGESEISLNDTRTYTVFKSNQKSNTASYNGTPQLQASNIKVNIEDLENRIKAAMKSKDMFTESEDPGRTNKGNTTLLNTNLTAAERIAMSAFNYKDDESIDDDSDRVNSLMLLKALSKANSSNSLGNTSSDSSDLVVGNPIGRNRFWINDTLQDDEKNDSTEIYTHQHALRTPSSNGNVSIRDSKQVDFVKDVTNICQEDQETNHNLHEVAIHNTNPLMCCTMLNLEPSFTTLNDK